MKQTLLSWEYIKNCSYEPLDVSTLLLQLYCTVYALWKEWKCRSRQKKKKNGTEKRPLLMVASSRQQSVFVTHCNLLVRTQAPISGYSSKCALDWISAGNESNSSGKVCEKQFSETLRNQWTAKHQWKFKDKCFLFLLFFLFLFTTMAEKGEASSAVIDYTKTCIILQHSWW